MTRRIVLAMTALVALVAIALAVPLAIVVSDHERDLFIKNLQIEALSAASLLSSQPQSRWALTASEVAEVAGGRVVVVDADSQLRGDSEGADAPRAFDRPELARALAGELASSVRTSATLGEDLQVVAAPIIQDQQVVGAVRLSVAAPEVNAVVAAVQRSLALFVLAVLAAAALVAWLVARSISAPLTRLAQRARALSDDLQVRADPRRGPTEVRAVATALNETAGRLSELVDRTERVAADASHHLRTPLTGVRLRLEAIEDESPDAGVRSNAVAAIVEVDRLSRRIDQVLALARGEVEARGEADLAAIARDRFEASRLAAAEAGITLALTAPDQLVVSCSAGTCARILDELLGNALAYARTAVAIEIAARESEASLAVSDDGPGIPEAEREQVFTRFVRGSGARPGGTGLGLALVRESVLAAGGSVSATESDLGGLQIRVRIPRLS